ncbi:hypothetical protein TL16_g05078 [Triparma laevis f. inornata]|uniref:Uncharacterized protein n=1 Tax=Triparma laevis f. inornata TaxID=1714386 RepID=A0A9W7AFR5_9STRA|nr:hypothetical protein TL16_g05078 [Triparma laevis f. inornata]
MGTSAGHVDRYWFAPSGVVYRSFASIYRDFPKIKISKEKFQKWEKRFHTVMVQQSASRRKAKPLEAIDEIPEDGLTDIEREWKRQRLVRPRLISAPTWLSALTTYSILINKRFDLHAHYVNEFDLNDVLTEEESVHYCIPLKGRDQLLFTVANSDAFVSVIEPLKTNIMMMVDSWKTDLKYMHKGLWLKFANSLEKAELRCSPSLLVESLSYFLLAMKPENLYGTIGLEATRDQLIQNIKAQTIQHSRPSLEATPLCCCSCYTLMKLTEVQRLVTNAPEEVLMRVSGRFARTQKKTTTKMAAVRMTEYGTIEGQEPNSDPTPPAATNLTPPMADDEPALEIAKVGRPKSTSGEEDGEPEYELSEYELKRLERIKRNNEFLKNLGLAPEDEQKPKEKKKKEKEPSKEPSRKNPGRAATKDVTYTDAALEKKNLIQTTPTTTSKKQPQTSNPSIPEADPNTSSNPTPSYVPGAAFKPALGDPIVDPTTDLPVFTKHPLFRTFFCLPCANTYHEKVRHQHNTETATTSRTKAASVNDFVIEEKQRRKNTEYLCSLCARHSYPKKASASKVGPDAAANIVCTRRACDRSFCEKCVLWLAGGGELTIATTVPGWICFICRESNFCRPNQAENLKEFLIEDNPDLLPPSDPNDIDPNDMTKMPASKMRDQVKMTSFGQQNKLISNA